MLEGAESEVAMSQLIELILFTIIISIDFVYAVFFNNNYYYSKLNL